MKMKILTLTFLFFCSSLLLKAERIDMRQAGANPSGEKLNTELINKTITRLNASGGGTLFFPSGKYLTGAIKLKSNITIELEAGATLLFSDQFDDYLPYVEVRHEGVMMNSFAPLIGGADAENITIIGEGKIDGQGKKWWDEFFRVIIDLKNNGKRDINKYQPMWEKANDVKSLYAEVNEDFHGSLDRRFFRPPLIQFLRCKNIKIEGITLVNSPFWTVNPNFCENLTIDGITILNPDSPNTDGINPESCKYVRISNCHISVGDDCITLKSGRDLQARKLNAPNENITIINCTMLDGHGGVVIGSEMSGGVKKVVISNCVFDGTDRGIRIKSTRGRGGVVEDIQVSNIVMKNIKDEAIILDMKYSKMPEEPLSERTPIFRNINISNMTGSGLNIPIKIRGLEESPITGITLTNIYLEAKGNNFFESCKDIRMNNVWVNGEEIKAP